MLPGASSCPHIRQNCASYVFVTCSEALTAEMISETVFSPIEEFSVPAEELDMGTVSRITEWALVFMYGLMGGVLYKELLGPAATYE